MSENDLLGSRPGEDPKGGESEGSASNTDSIGNPESQTDDEPVLDTGEAQFEALGATKEEVVGYSRSSESDDDDIFNAF